MVTNMTIPAPGIRLFNRAVMHRYVDEYILKIVWWISCIHLQDGFSGFDFRSRISSHACWVG